jgi:hypothetical protein
MLRKILIGLFLFAPVLAAAQTTINRDLGGIGTSIGFIVDFINKYLVPLVFALAFLFFLWGLFKYFFWNTEEGKESGKQLMLWGIIAFVVMVSIWGIVNLLASGLGLRTQDPGTLPRGPRVP